MKVRDQRIQAVQDDKKSKRPVDLGWIFFSNERKRPADTEMYCMNLGKKDGEKGCKIERGEDIYMYI